MNNHNNENSSSLDLFDDHSAKEQQVTLQNICMNNYMLARISKY